MITLNDEEKAFVRDRLQSKLKENDIDGIRKALVKYGNCGNISLFFIEHGIDVLLGLDRITGEEARLFNGVSSITIPSHIVSIGKNAFLGMGSLSRVTLSDGLESIEESAFRGTGIEIIKIPKTVTYLGKYAFSNCFKLTTVILPESISSLPKGLFDGCSSLESIYTNSRKDLPVDKQLRCVESELDFYINHIKLNTDYLYEHYSLHEAWSPSTPNWLKPRLNTLAKNFGDERWHRGHYEPYDPGAPLGYKHPRGTPYRVTKDLYGKLRNAGIDFETIEFIEGEVPTSAKDPRLQAPNVGVWHFPNGQVYMQGINELEKYGEDDLERNFGSLPFKTLKTDADAFCYFNMEQPGKKDYDLLKSERDEYRDWLMTETGVRNSKKSERKRKGADPSRYSYYDVDKSGYTIIPSSEKYADVLKRFGARKYAEKLESLEKRLREVYVVIQKDVLSDYDWDKFVYSSVDTIMRQYDNALEKYKDSLSSLKKAEENNGKDTDAFFDEISREYPWGFSGYVKDANKYLDTVENSVKEYKRAYIDF